MLGFAQGCNKEKRFWNSHCNSLKISRGVYKTLIR